MYSDPKKVFCISFRYIVILYPFRTRMQMKPCCFLIGVINLLSMAFTAPYVYIMESVRNKELGTAQCQVSGLFRLLNVYSNYIWFHHHHILYNDIYCLQESWQGPPKTVYGIFTNITQFVIPFITIIICYASVIQRLNKRSNERPGGPRSSSREAQERARTKRTNRMLIMMVIVFGVCWLPLNSINFLADLNGRIYCWEYFHFTFFITHVFAMSSTCYNPFLYGRYNEKFQEEFVRMLPMLKFICKTNNNKGKTNVYNVIVKMLKFPSILFLSISNIGQTGDPLPKEAIEEPHEVIPMHSFIVTNTTGHTEVPTSENNIIHPNNDCNTNSKSGHLTIPNISNHTSPNTTSLSNTSSPLLNKTTVIQQKWSSTLLTFINLINSAMICK